VLGTPGFRFICCEQSVTREQYVKQETSTIGEHGKEARATRLITERASKRIGQIAFEIALTRPRKVRPFMLPDDRSVSKSSST
jgi:homoisocitrate dehydrogenase